MGSVGQQKCTSPGATQPLAPDVQSQDVTGLVSDKGLGEGRLHAPPAPLRQLWRLRWTLWPRGSPPSVNWSRTVNMSASFGLTAGLLCHHWYRLLDNFLPGRTLKTIVFKIAWDQVLFSPICIAACIFVSGAVFEAKSPSQIIKDTKELGTQLWLSEWFIWPPAQFVNFYFL